MKVMVAENTNSAKCRVKQEWRLREREEDE